MKPAVIPAHAQRVLQRLKGVRPTRDGWDALCPCPGHNQDGDQHASLRVTLGDDGRILIMCRVGCMTDAVRDALELDWSDLFPPDADEAFAGADEHTDAVDNTVAAVAVGQEKADTDVCHRAYQLLLDGLQLAAEHRADLQRRGLPDAEIDRRGYRSLRNVDRGRAAKAVQQQLGDAVLRVPGFVRGDFGVTLHGEATGLLVPVRDLQGRIVALKVRRATEPKYMYLTSGLDGLSPGSPVHVPLGVTAPVLTVRVTEGELKSDVCVALSDTPTIGVPGVTQWRPVLPMLKTLGAKTVILAFDAPDVRTKPPVFEQAELLYRALLCDGYHVELEDWDD